MLTKFQHTTVGTQVWILINTVNVIADRLRLATHSLVDLYDSKFVIEFDA